MWDRPEILNRISSALVALALLLFAYGAVAVVVQLPVFALREVRVLGGPSHVTRTQVESIVKNEMKGTFFTLNLPAVRRAFERLPWVREVNLRRQWPDRLDITLVEHVALARWNNAALVNTRGEIFQAAFDGALPAFAGPPGTSKEVTSKYEYFRRTLEAVDVTPAAVQLTPRRAWHVRLSSGPVIDLGREDIEGRLGRFVAVYGRTLATLNRRVDHIDLRYANGFAVRIPELKGEPTGAQRMAASAKRKTRGI